MILVCVASIFFSTSTWILLNMRIVGPGRFIYTFKARLMLRVCEKIEGNILKHHRMLNAKEQICINTAGVP